MLLCCASRIPFYMTTDCENLLRKFLVLNPAKRASLETIMGDKWMNMGFEDDELKPYIEPKQDLADPKRIGKTGTVYLTIVTNLTTIIQKSFSGCLSYIILILLIVVYQFHSKLLNRSSSIEFITTI